ncbi:hypothetical protein AAHA92_10341 [Salvia divinorum]|uniref:Uncharacterized protein n=1 Tax=Salvia divinorum TaxID=28513 RepID=A0ABD1HUB8_SALDI
MYKRFLALHIQRLHRARVELLVIRLD